MPIHNRHFNLAARKSPIGLVKRLSQRRPQDFRAERADGIVITNDTLDGKPLLETKKDTAFDFPVSTTDTEAKCTI